MKADILNWQTRWGRWSLDFSRPQVMSIINVTPDSFSDGGLYPSAEAVAEAAAIQEAEGADIFDMGAESTRPGACPVSADEEWDRLAPALSLLTARTRRPISVDTYKAEVAEKAVAAGAAIINDIWAGRREPEILAVVARHQVPIVLMHMKGEPRTMQLEPHYEDVVAEVYEFLAQRAEAALAAGVAREKIWLDPGLGFGKTEAHNLSLIKHFDRAVPRGFRRVMALSRKGFLGRILGGVPPAERDFISAVAGALSLWQGADIVRVHRVGLNRQAALLVAALRAAR